MNEPAHADGAGSIGRVLEATISRFTCVCHALDGAPPLGTLVLVFEGGPAVYGVVADIRTQSIDPGRPLTPRGGPEDDRETVLAQNPQIPALLQTAFEAIVVGHRRDGGVRRYLPDSPPRIYARVRACTAAETAEFFHGFEFLPLLLAAGPLADQVIAACLRRAAAAMPAHPRAFLVQAGRALAHELAAEPERLAAVFGQIRSVAAG
jgi:hypothetical protein